MSRRTTRTLLVLALGSVLLAGCTEGGTSTPPEASGSPSESPSGSEAAPTDEPSESSSSEAAGERMDTPVGSIALPADWEVDGSNELQASSRSGRSLLSIYDLGEVGLVTVKQLGRTLVDGSGADEPELAFDVEMDGEQGFAVRETALADDRAHYLFGSVRDGRAVQVSVVLSKTDLPLGEQEAFIDEVLASYTWAG